MTAGANPVGCHQGGMPRTVAREQAETVLLCRGRRVHAVRERPHRVLYHTVGVLHQQAVAVTLEKVDGGREGRLHPTMWGIPTCDEARAQRGGQPTAMLVDASAGDGAMATRVRPEAVAGARPRQRGSTTKARDRRRTRPRTGRRGSGPAVATRQSRVDRVRPARRARVPPVAGRASCRCRRGRRTGHPRAWSRTVTGRQRADARSGRRRRRRRTPRPRGCRRWAGAPLVPRWPPAAPRD